MKTLADVQAEYDVVDGVIRSPGKFEGEAWFAPIVYEWSLDGGGELLYVSDVESAGVEYFPIEDVERDMFELDSEHIGIVLEWTDLGFVSVSAVTAIELENIRSRLEAVTECDGQHAECDCESANEHRYNCSMASEGESTQWDCETCLNDLE